MGHGDLSYTEVIIVFLLLALGGLIKVLGYFGWELIRGGGGGGEFCKV